MFFDILFGVLSTLHCSLILTMHLVGNVILHIYIWVDLLISSDVKI